MMSDSDLSRSAAHCQSRPVSDSDLFLMWRIDELHLSYPFAGSCMLRDMLSLPGLEVGRRYVRSLIRRMGIETLYRKPNTSKPASGHRIYPYLPRGLAITRRNQVWSTDITYIQSLEADTPDQVNFNPPPLTRAA